MFKIEDVKISYLEDGKLTNIENTNYNKEYKKEQLKLNKTIEFNECKFNDVILSESIINNGYFIDIIFKNCDLSNANLTGSSFRRVVFDNCKLIGTDFIDCNIDDVIFKDSILSYTNFSDSKIKNVSYLNNNMENAYISNVKLSEVIFIECNLESVEFLNTDLKNIDLSTDKIFNLKANNIRGLIVDEFGALELSRMLGIRIKE